MPSNPTLVAVIAILVLIVVALIAYTLSQRRRSEELKSKFGPEYEHAVQTYGNQQRAEQELEAREKRVQVLDIHPLTPDERARFAESWRQVQSKFVDDPSAAIAQAQDLLKQVMQARGYPMGDFEQRAADISVNYPDVVSNYRRARDLGQADKQGKATTEDLRQAMVLYRKLFDDLLEAPSNQKTEKEKEKVH